MALSLTTCLCEITCQWKFPLFSPTHYMINRNVLCPDNIVLRAGLIHKQVPKPGLQAGCGFKLCLLGLLREKNREVCQMLEVHRYLFGMSFKQ